MHVSVAGYGFYGYMVCVRERDPRSMVGDIGVPGRWVPWNHEMDVMPSSRIDMRWELHLHCNAFIHCIHDIRLHSRS